MKNEQSSKSPEGRNNKDQNENKERREKTPPKKQTSITTKEISQKYNHNRRLQIVIYQPVG